MNRVELRGGLTRDAELRYLPSGVGVLEFTLAVNGARYDAQAREQVVTTQFISVQAWAWLAEELADTELCKGDEVYVLGELDQRTVEKEDGSKESKTRVTAFLVQVTRRRREQASSQRQTAPIGEEPF